MRTNAYRRVLTLAATAALLASAGLPEPAVAVGRTSQRVSNQGPARGERAQRKTQTGTRQLIVRYRQRADAADRREARIDARVRRTDSLSLFEQEVVRVPPGERVTNAIARLEADPDVLYAEPDHRVYALGHGGDVPDDPGWSDLWGLENRGQVIQGHGGQTDVDVDALRAWRETEGDSDLVVAVVDSGVDIEHPDLRDRIWTNPGEIAGNGIDDDDNGYVDDVHGWDFLNDDASVFDDDQIDAHGTHVAGTIAASVDNATGVAGVAPAVQIMPLKFLGPAGGELSDAIAALEYASTQGVRISNHSWGGYEFSAALRDAIRQSGQMFVAAAGNEGNNNDGQYPSYPASYDLPTIVSVAAVDNAGEVPRFSNYGGDSVDVGAPGVGVLSTVPRRRDAVLGVGTAAAAYRTMFWGFGLEDVAGASARADLLQRGLEFLDAVPLTPILLVDDDEDDPDVVGFYEGALVAAGFTDVTVRTVAPDERGPVAAEMSGRTVIWQTGAAFGDPLARPPVRTLRSADLTALRNHLGGGGRLLLAGSDALFGQEGSDLVTRDLRIRFVSEGDLRASLQGAPGSVYAGEAYTLDGSDSRDGKPNPYHDEVSPIDPAATAALVLPAEADYGKAYEYYKGTSMASPHAAGVAALIASIRPNATPTQLADHVLVTGVPLPSLAGRTATGRMVNAARALVGTDLGLFAPATIVDGEAVFPLARLVRPGFDEPVAGATLVLQARQPEISPQWSRLRVRSTDYRGEVAFGHRPRVATEYRARFYGDGKLLAAMSDVMRVAVRPNVQAALSTQRATVNETVAIRGSVSPRHPGSRILLQRYNGRWRSIKATRLDSYGRYGFRRRERRAGTYRNRVVLPRHDDHAAGISEVLTLQVR
ncbi:MAG: S8 family serine peptidase [Egibacteraceae bacterium]